MLISTIRLIILCHCYLFCCWSSLLFCPYCYMKKVSQCRTWLEMHPHVNHEFYTYHQSETLWSYVLKKISVLHWSAGTVLCAANGRNWCYTACYDSKCRNTHSDGFPPATPDVLLLAQLSLFQKQSWRTHTHTHSEYLSLDESLI